MQGGYHSPTKNPTICPNSEIRYFLVRKERFELSLHCWNRILSPTSILRSQRLRRDVPTKFHHQQVPRPKGAVFQTPRPSHPHSVLLPIPTSAARLLR